MFKQIHIMNEISLSSHDLSTMCRLCLTRDVTLIDIFSVSIKMRSKVADIIMKCTPVQITKDDEMPNFICQVCYTQLEQIHQFQMQAVQSEKTFRQYLQQIHVFDKQITPECSIQTPFIHNSVGDATVKCESFECLEFDRKDKELANIDKIYEEISLKTMVKGEPTDDYNLTSTECHNDSECILPDNDVSDISYEDSDINVNDSKLGENIDINWEAKESENFNTIGKINEELCPKFEIKDEPTNDYSSNLIESVENTENSFSKGDCSEISCKDTKIDVDHTSESSCSADARNNFDKREDRNQNTFVNRLKHKKTNEMDYKFEKQLQCDVCNKCFRLPSHLKEHHRVHTGEKPYQCNVCKKCFSQTSNYKNHMRTHTGEKPYQCDICKKYFSRVGNLNTHKRVHTGEKPFQCDVCNASFSDSSILRRHKRIHTGEKPYQCDVCNANFYDPSILRRHKRIHTADKPYQCDVCKKCFSQDSSLNNHKRTHTGEKPYQCEICNKCFNQPRSLNMHNRTHTGEKPYRCDFCTKCFSHSSNLITHKRTHTGKKPQ